MKKQISLLLLLPLLCCACGNEGREAEQKVDRAMQKVADKATVLADSAKEKYKDVRDHLDTAFDRNEKDTAH